jgi:integrase
MPLTLRELTAPGLVAEWLSKENARGPTQAALAYRLLRAFVHWAAGEKKYHEEIDLSAFSAKVAKDNVHRPKAKDGDCLQREQLALWFKAVRELQNKVQSAYLQGLLLTGSRSQELAKLQWPDVDFKWKSLRLGDKVAGERVIPMCPYFASLLVDLPRRSGWVFSSPTAASGRLHGGRSAHQRALAAAGLPHVTLHGLRRSFGTLSEWLETPVGVVAQIQGHKPSAIAEKHYRRRPLDMLRMWHAKIEAWMLAEAGVEQPIEDGKVLRIA